MKVNRERINQAVFEIAIITVSILLAFALERWWDAREDSQSRDELVSSLIQEFGTAEAEFESALRSHRNRQVSASRLSDLDEDTIADVDPAEISEHWYWTVTPDETYPPTGALLSAINDNRVALLASSALRSRLASWVDRLEDLRQTERVLADYTLQIFLPSVGADVVIPLSRQAVGRTTDRVILKPSTRNHLNVLSLGSSVAIGQIMSLQDELDEILRLLRAEIEG